MSCCLVPNDDQKEVSSNDDDDEQSILNEFQEIMSNIPETLSQKAVSSCQKVAAVATLKGFREHLNDKFHYKKTVKDILSKITSFTSEFFEMLTHEVWMEVLSFIKVMKDPNAEQLLKMECIAALLYLVTPLDAIPDTLPGIGLIDDHMIILKVKKDLGEKLNQYREEVQAKLGGKTKEVVTDKGQSALNDIIGHEEEDESSSDDDEFDDIRSWKVCDDEEIKSQRLAVTEAQKIWEKESDKLKKMKKIKKMNAQFEELTEEVVSLRKQLQLKEKEIAELKEKQHINSSTDMTGRSDINLDRKNDESICSNRMATCTVL